MDQQQCTFDMLVPDQQLFEIHLKIVNTLIDGTSKYSISKEDILSIYANLYEYVEAAFRLGATFGYKQCGVDAGLISAEQAKNMGKGGQGNG